MIIVGAHISMRKTTDTSTLTSRSISFCFPQGVNVRSSQVPALFQDEDPAITSATFTSVSESNFFGLISPIRAFASSSESEKFKEFKDINSPD